MGNHKESTRTSDGPTGGGDHQIISGGRSSVGVDRAKVGSSINSSATRSIHLHTSWFVHMYCCLVYRGGLISFCPAVKEHSLPQTSQ